MLARLLALMLAGTVVAPAQARDDTARIRAAVARGEALPLPRILQIARQRMAGEILAVEFAGLSYAIRMLAPDGQLRAIRLDARTGATLALD
jgi:uncharacterized membrane protein YkoI